MGTQRDRFSATQMLKQKDVKINEHVEKEIKYENTNCKMVMK